MGFKMNWDALGIATSLACAIHCALLPLFLTSLPVLGIELLSSTSFEVLMIVLAFCIGAYSLIHGYLKHHHTLLPLLVFVLGFSCLVAKQVWHHFEIPLLLLAVIGIITAHILNYRKCRKAGHCHTSDCNH
ncbi:MAG: MerC domain-containing protein [Chitinophagaceae bacterium]